MSTFVIFAVSLVLMALLFVTKALEIYSGRKIFLEKFFWKCDALIWQTILRLRFWWSHVNFKNTKRVLAWIVIRTHRQAVTIKRRYDHKQSHFFTKKELPSLKSKKSASFFLKNVSEFKKNLREGK